MTVARTLGMRRVAMEVEAEDRRPVLVGEANPYGGDLHYALWPDPPGCAGHRLCHKVLSMSEDDYLKTFRRVNLCPRNWNAVEARDRARLLVEQEGPLILLGSKVSRAFGLEYLAFSRGTVGDKSLLGDLQVPYVILPHPSGRNLTWNVVGNFERAASLVREIVEYSRRPVHSPSGDEDVY